jgi:Na+/H+ antiporter NhaA
MEIIVLQEPVKLSSDLFIELAGNAVLTSRPSILAIAAINALLKSKEPTTLKMFLFTLKVSLSKQDLLSVFFILNIFYFMKLIQEFISFEK